MPVEGSGITDVIGQQFSVPGSQFSVKPNIFSDRWSQRQARGSLVEIETQLLISKDLKYLQPAKANDLLTAAEELGRILNGLIASIKSRVA